jgi:uncharacterized protein HemY
MPRSRTGIDAKLTRLLAAAIGAQKRGDAKRARALLDEAIKRMDQDAPAVVQQQQQIQPRDDKKE